jgi:hypothetical protein
VMRRHAELLVAAHRGEAYALRDFRKHTGWYFTGYPVGGARRKRFSMVSSLAELDDLLAELDPTAELPPGHDLLPRGHLNGPRQVTLPEGWRERADDPAVPEDADLFVSGG